MGMTVFAGMATATVIGIIIVPALYVFIARKGDSQKPADATEGTD
jgi:Cu/Ag efflux pump CusA